MRAIKAFLDGYSVAADVRMQRQIHKGTFALVEGVTDFKRFQKMIDELSCCIIICHSKRNVVEAVDLLYDEGFAGVIGLADADFDRILNKELVHEGLVYSATHDFDLDMACTQALTRYFNEVCEHNKLSALGGAHGVLQHTLEALRPLSALRYANQRHNLRYRLGDLDLADFYDGIRIDVDSMINAASTGKFNDPKSRTNLKEHVQKYANADYDLHQFISGHDVCAAIGVCLRSHLGQRRLAQTLRSEIEMHLRLSIHRPDLDETGLSSRIVAWELENKPYRVLA